MVRIMLPPVLRIAGRNFRIGSRMNFSLAKNLTINMPTTANGAKSFFILAQSVGSPHSAGAGAGGNGGGWTGGSGGITGGTSESMFVNMVYWAPQRSK